MEETIKLLKEIKEHQMQTVQLARTTKVYKLADKALKAITVIQCCAELPTKEEIILEGEKQIAEWLEANYEIEKQAYRIGFRRSFEYVLRLMKK